LLAFLAIGHIQPGCTKHQLVIISAVLQAEAFAFHKITANSCFANNALVSVEIAQFSYGK